jgi:hypothetical protein
MARRRTSAAIASDDITTVEPVPMEDLEESTVEDYQKLNEKLDNIKSKINGRKETRAQGKRKKK